MGMKKRKMKIQSIPGMEKNMKLTLPIRTMLLRPSQKSTQPTIQIFEKNVRMQKKICDLKKIIFKFFLYILRLYFIEKISFSYFK